MTMKNRTRSRTDLARRAASTVALGAAVLLAPAIAGCNIVGPAFFLVHGPGTVDAAHELDRERTTVIFIDDPANKVGRRRYRSIIAETAQDIMLQKKIVVEGKMIDGRSAITYAATATADDPHSLQDIGEALRADVVIYALVSEFNISGLGGDASPSVTMHVKVFDAAAGERAWPAEPEGYRLNLRMPAAPSTVGATQAERRETEETLAQFAGLGLAQLFYDVERPQSVRLP